MPASCCSMPTCGAATTSARCSTPPPPSAGPGPCGRPATTSRCTRWAIRSIFASYSNVDSGTVAAGIFDLAVSGKGAVLARATRMRWPSAATGVAPGLRRRLQGLQERRHVRRQNFGNDVTVHPLSIGYRQRRRWRTAKPASPLTVLQNIAGGSRGGTRDFRRWCAPAPRPATPCCAFGRHLERDRRRLADPRAANGQATGDALVPGEQFGAGGSTTVRGFGERDLATDSGLGVNVELYTPNLCTRAGWQCRLLGFYDSAWGQRNHILPGELRRTAISSAGPGPALRRWRQRQRAARLRPCGPHRRDRCRQQEQAARPRGPGLLRERE
jgi:hypothetical protein